LASCSSLESFAMAAPQTQRIRLRMNFVVHRWITQRRKDAKENGFGCHHSVFQDEKPRMTRMAAEIYDDGQTCTIRAYRRNPRLKPNRVTRDVIFVRPSGL